MISSIAPTTSSTISPPTTALGSTIPAKAVTDTSAPPTAGTSTPSTAGPSVPHTTGTVAPAIAKIVGTSSSTKRTTGISTTTAPTCEISSALINDRFLSKPEFSTPITGSISDMNLDEKGIDFVVNTPSTAVTMLLPLKENIIITNLVKFQIPRPSNVNRFRLTFLNKQKQPIGGYHILSTDSTKLSISPTIDKFPIKTNLFKTIRSLKIEILDTDDNHPPKQVTFLFQACFKQTKIPSTSKYYSYF